MLGYLIYSRIEAIGKYLDVLSTVYIHFIRLLGPRKPLKIVLQSEIDEIIPFMLAEGMIPSIPRIMSDLPSFTRSQIMQMTGLDAASMDYWSKLGVLQASNSGGGKGKHRKFDAYQVTTAAILFELQKLGVGGKALKDVAATLRAALDWFTEHRLVGSEEAAGSLMEYRQEIEKNGFALRELPTQYNESGQPTPTVSVKMNWKQVIDYHRKHLKKMGPVSDDLAKQCLVVSYEEYSEHSASFFAISPLRRSSHYLEFMYLCPLEGGGYSVEFNKAPAEVRSFLAINIVRLKEELWDQP